MIFIMWHRYYLCVSTIYLFIYLSIYAYYLCMHKLSIYLSNHFSIYRSIKRFLYCTVIYFSICPCIYLSIHCSILQTIEEFHNIFGAELKAVTGDPAQIEKVLEKVDGLVVHLETVRFDPYQQQHKQDWKNSMGWFQREVELIESEATR